MEETTNPVTIDPLYPGIHLSRLCPALWPHGSLNL